VSALAVQPMQIAAAARIMRDPATPRSFLYFVQISDDGPIKIGITVNIRERLKTLQQACPWPLRIIGLTLEPTLLEATIHEALAEHRMLGEWFAPHDDVLAEAAMWHDPILRYDFPELLAA
jgi:hypothetical protein